MSKPNEQDVSAAMTALLRYFPAGTELTILSERRMHVQFPKLSQTFSLSDPEKNGRAGKVLSAAQIARRLKISRSKLYSMVKENQIPAHKEPGQFGRILFDEAELVAWEKAR